MSVVAPATFVRYGELATQMASLANVDNALRSAQGSVAQTEAAIAQQRQALSSQVAAQSRLEKRIHRNEQVGLLLGARDIGGSMTIHALGAMLGLACSRTSTQAQARKRPIENAPVYHSDLFSMIGTLFIWVYWPSFNSALGNDAEESRIIVNTLAQPHGQRSLHDRALAPAARAHRHGRHPERDHGRRRRHGRRL
jgi:hypothetical protein